MSDIKKKNFWHYKEFPVDPDVAKLMPDFRLEYMISKDTVEHDENSLVWNHSIFPAGAEHCRHLHHNADEVAYIVAGRCLCGVCVDGQDIEIICGPGTAVYAARGQAHWHKNIFDEPCEFVGVYAGCGSLEDSGYEDFRTEEELKADAEKLKKMQL